MPQLGPLEKDRLTLAVGGKSAFYYLPLTIAEQLGYFRAQGLTLEIADYADAELAQQAALLGQADVVCGEFEQTLHLQTKKQYYQAFVQLARTPQLVLGMSTRSSSGLRSAADLRGKTIGIPASGSSPSGLASVLSQRVLARAGLTPGDVSFAALESTPAALQALRGGQIDALCHTDPVMTLLEIKGDIRVLCDTRTLKDTLDMFGGLMPFACLYARVGFVQNLPRTCQALTNSVVRALKWLQTAGPTDLMKVVPEPYWQGDRAAYLAAFSKLRESTSLDGVLPSDAALTAWRVFAAETAPAIRLPTTVVPADRIVLARTFTNVYAQRAKTAFKL